MRKRIYFTNHALEQMEERGAGREEVQMAILKGDREKTREGRFICRLTIPFGKTWGKKNYSWKQVVPVIAEEKDQTVVITVLTFYF